MSFPRQAGLRPLLLEWFSKVRGRREMPWRRTRDPYAIWISEVMLQQTRAATAAPYYERFLATLPTVSALAEASVEQVLSLWSGLGYYRRARMLHAAARQVVEQWGGQIPRQPEDLRKLRGVGPYTAGAVASIAYGVAAPLVDGNVARVLSRLFAVEDDVNREPGRGRIRDLARQLVTAGRGDPGDWNQALMELGATVCVPGRPHCDRCPVSAHCAARAEGIAADLPRTASARAPLLVPRVALVLASAGAVLLARRRAGGLFGGLWEPPGADGGAAPLARRMGVDLGRLRRVGEVVHTLSHRRFVVDVRKGALGRRVRWPLPGPDYDAVEVVSLPRLAALAQASLARKVLVLAHVAPPGLLSSREE